MSNKCAPARARANRTASRFGATDIRWVGGIEGATRLPPASRVLGTEGDAPWTAGESQSTPASTRRRPRTSGPLAATRALADAQTSVYLRMMYAGRCHCGALRVQLES